MLFIIDFDGTISPADVVDELLERFADPAWREIEDRWVRGEINSQQCMAEQIALINGDRRLVERFLEAVEIDPSFTEFVDYAVGLGEVAVVSDGLDVPIRHALDRAGLAIPFFANKLEYCDSGFRLSFPYRDASCAVNSGVCKCAVARSIDAGRSETTVLIGDGRSDQCIARTADFVFAKGSLRTFCEAEGINHTPFDSFADVLKVVQGWAVSARDESQETRCPLAVSSP